VCDAIYEVMQVFAPATIHNSWYTEPRQSGVAILNHKPKIYITSLVLQLSFSLYHNHKWQSVEQLDQHCVTISLRSRHLMTFNLIYFANLFYLFTFKLFWLPVIVIQHCHPTLSSNIVIQHCLLALSAYYYHQPGTSHSGHSGHRHCKSVS
jgi:hypothetical protein